MKRKIIDMLSTAILMDSLIVAPFVAISDDPELLPFLVWMAAVVLSTVWMMKRVDEKEKVPDEQQLSQGHNKKIYNFNLTEEWGKVNDSSENI